MKLNTLIIIIYFNFVLIGIGLAGLIIDNEILKIVLSVGLSFFILNGSFLLLKAGNFYKTSEFKFTGFGIFFIIVGLMFKVMHWPFSSPLIGIGYLTIISTYIIYMLKSRALLLENWMKLTFVTTLFAGGFFKLMHWPYNKELTIISIMVLGILIVRFLMNRKVPL